MGKKTWTDQEKSFLQENINNMTYEKLGKKLNRNVNAVAAKAKAMGLDKKESKNIRMLKREAELESSGRRKMKEFKLNLKKGQKVSLAIRENNRVLRKIKGQVVGKNKNFITLQALNYKESFLVSDFYSGVSQILG